MIWSYTFDDSLTQELLEVLDVSVLEDHDGGAGQPHPQDQTRVVQLVGEDEAA